ncbi:beta-1,6-N-acetylglucosaminyltransferase [Mucilaginibacter sp. CSA2-8R]|uniref:beta-1,6-N-acetylglucosaminyltransferase n=1 Tax=Mucilaginibacter sp. CSA2-8R TaxID=3141542 RepID=UPI00315CE460
MKIAHLILAHNNPSQLESLVKRLIYKDDAVYIHLDKKTDFSQFARLASLPNVIFVKKRVKVTWGACNIVTATINGFKEIIASGVAYDYLNLLSGADYPLQPPAAFHQYLSAHQGKAFMSYAKMHSEWQEALPRVEQYHLNNFKFPGRYVAQKLVNRVMPKRNVPSGLVPVGRSQWFTIPVACVRHIVSYWQKNNRLRRFTTFTWAPDEFIFQTILYNSTHCKILVNNNLRYMDWPAGAASPKMLSMADHEHIINSEHFFARKFDFEKSPDLLNLLNQRLEQSANLN